MDININSNPNSGPQPAEIFALEAVRKLGKNRTIRANRSIDTETSIPLFVDILEEVASEKAASVEVLYGFQSTLLLTFSNFVMLLTATGSDKFEVKEKHVQLSIWGGMEEVEVFYKRLKEVYPKKDKDYITWYFESDKRIENKITSLKHKNEAHDAFFPWIKDGIAAFQQEFKLSDANVLVLMGEAGCGKTSFLREFIKRSDINTAVTYDEELMKRDEFYLKFIQSSHDLLVIEDADVLLSDRQNGNRIMGKLLNTADGLIQTNKKIVFTTNLTNPDDIDPALIRPGRCFDVVTFRELTHSEAKIAAQVAGLPEPNGPKTLAQLFAKHSAKPVEPSFGFRM